MPEGFKPRHGLRPQRQRLHPGGHDPTGDDLKATHTSLTPGSARSARHCAREGPVPRPGLGGRAFRPERDPGHPQQRCCDRSPVGCGLDRQRVGPGLRCRFGIAVSGSSSSVARAAKAPVGFPSRAPAAAASDCLPVHRPCGEPPTRSPPSPPGCAEPQINGGVRSCAEPLGPGTGAGYGAR